MISVNLRPAEMDGFKSKWEQLGQYSNLLGFYFKEEDFDSEMVLHRIKRVWRRSWVRPN
jgi:hypothetical protein